jgi:hypothetical protein
MSYFDDYVEDGLCCAMCGEFMGGSEPGHIVYCSTCAQSLKEQDRHESRVPSYRPPPRKPKSHSKAKGEKVACSDCGRMVSPLGLAHHRLDKHGLA